MNYVYLLLNYALLVDDEVTWWWFFWINLNAGGEEDGSRVKTQYMVLFDNILHRLRFPKFMEIVSGELDDKVGFDLCFSLKLFDLRLKMLKRFFHLFCSVRKFLRVCSAMVDLPWNRWLTEKVKEKACVLLGSYYVKSTVILISSA